MRGGGGKRFAANARCGIHPATPPERTPRPLPLAIRSIMMSQNRRASNDRLGASLDHAANLLAALETKIDGLANRAPTA
jgi:hypothetical protein